MPLLWFLLLHNVFHIIQASTLKSGVKVGTSFILLFANCGEISLNGFKVIGNDRLSCNFSNMMFLEIKLNTSFSQLQDGIILQSACMMFLLLIHQV